MRKKLIFLITFFIVMHLEARMYQGMDVKGDTIVFAEKGQVYIANISSSKILFQFKPNADTSLVKRIFKAALKNPELTGETRKQMKNSIAAFGIANLSWVNSELLLGFYYFEGKLEESNLKFGVIKYSLDFKNTEFCLLNSKGNFLSLNPYFPLEIHNRILFLPYIKDSLYIGQNEFNFKLNELQFVGNSKTVRMKGIQRHILSSIMINQIPFSIRNTQFNSFLFYPYPCIINGSSHVFSDPYSTYAKLINKKQIPVYSEGRFLDIEKGISKDTQVFISSYSNKDSMWVLCSGKNSNQLQLLIYGNRIAQPVSKPINYNSEYRYFLSKNRVIGIRFDSGKLDVILIN